jgi:hypothetical protein
VPIWLYMDRGVHCNLKKQKRSKGTLFRSSKVASFSSSAYGTSFRLQKIVIQVKVHRTALLAWRSPHFVSSIYM